MAGAFHGPQPFWVGAAASPATPKGFRSLFAFWMGGASIGAVTPDPPPAVGVIGSMRRFERFERPIRQEDADDVLLLMAAQIAIGMVH